MSQSVAASIAEGLRRPFELVDLEWRAMFTRDEGEGKSPLILVAPYVQRPALVNRLNQVCGPGGWASEARVSGGHVYVGVAVRYADELVWRWDGTGLLEPDPPKFTASDAGKGNFSNAFKRACELHGCGLYLREIPALRAIVNSSGRYKSKVKGKQWKWDPPELQGGPSYPGEIPNWTEGTDGPQDEPSSAPDAPEQAPPKGPSKEELAGQLQDAKNRVRAFMTDHGYRLYHLDALVQTHPELKARFVSAEELGRKGSLEDWGVLTKLCDPKRATRWDQGPKELAEEYPTAPERLQELDRLLDSVKLESKELIEARTAKTVGWNDAVEYWIEELRKR